MELSVSLPLDNGYLRRQCPKCARQFKWHHGPTEERPDDFADPPFYRCPYCGEASGPDQWLTQEQVDYIQGMMAGPALRHVTDELKAITRRHSGGLFKLSVESSGEPEPPDPLIEPDDMGIVASPCHPWEPVKVDEGWQVLHCLVCGSKYSGG